MRYFLKHIFLRGALERSGLTCVSQWASRDAGALWIKKQSGPDPTIGSLALWSGYSRPKTVIDIGKGVGLEGKPSNIRPAPVANQSGSPMNPSDRATQADDIPIALFFQDRKPGAFIKQRDLGRGSIVPGVNRRLLFCHIPGRIDKYVA